MELVGIFKKNRKKRVKKWGFDTFVIFKKKNEKSERSSLYPNIGLDSEMFKKKKQKKYKKLSLYQNAVF